MSLPSAYMELPWIESTGHQGINTGLFAEASDRVEIRGRFTRIDVDQQMCGTHRSGYYRKVVCVMTRNNQTKFTASAGAWNENEALGWGHAGTPVADADTNTHVFVFNQTDKTLTIDATTYSLQSITNQQVPGSSTGRHMALFANFHDEEVPVDGAYFVLESARYYVGTTMVRDFVPAVRVADNKPGLYDLENDVFYTNMGTGDDFNFPLPSYKTMIKSGNTEYTSYKTIVPYGGTEMTDYQIIVKA